MKWTRTLVQNGFIKEEQGQEEYDPFFILSEYTKASGAIAEVSMELTSSTDFGKSRCTVKVTLKAAQTEQHINLAGTVAFQKALELVNVGATVIGVPTLPPQDVPF